MDKYIKVIPYNEAAPYYNVEKVWQANWKEVRWRNIHSTFIICVINGRKKICISMYACLFFFACLF